MDTTARLRFQTGTRVELLLAVAIMLLAAGLRLYDLRHAQYRNDDDTMFWLASQIVSSGSLPSWGMWSSLGVLNGPTAVYVLSVPVAVFGTELGATSFMALVNVVAVGATYVAVRHVFGTRLALITALLLAVNPWSVVYSRRTWLNAALPLFSVLFFWALLSTIRSLRRPSAILERSIRGDLLRGLAVGVSLSALVQVHLSAIAHLYTALIGAVAGQAWRRPAIFLAAVGAFAVSVAPYFATAFLPGVQSLLGGPPDGSSAGAAWAITIADSARFQQFLYLLTARGYQTYASQGGSLVDTTRGIFALADALMVGAFVLGVGVAAWRALRGAPDIRGVYLTLIGWVAAPVVLPAPAPGTGFFHHLYPLYFLVALPGALVLVAIGLEQAGTWLGNVRPGLRALTAVAATGVAALHLVAAGVFFAVLHQFHHGADYLLPLNGTIGLAEMTVARVGVGDQQVAVLGHDEISSVLHRVIQRRGADGRYFDDRDVIPVLEQRRQAFYLTTDENAWVTRHLRTNFAERQEAVYTVPGDGWTARLFRIDTDRLLRSLDGRAGSRTRVMLADVAALQSASLVGDAKPGSAIQVQVAWTLLQNIPYTCLVRFIAEDASGQGRIVHETEFQPVSFWGEGDGRRTTFHHRATATIPASAPAGPFTVSMQLIRKFDKQPLAPSAQLGSVLVEPG